MSLADEMKTSPPLAALARAWRNTADYFVPETLAEDREASNRARLFLVSHIFGPILGNTVPIALFVFDPTPQMDILILTFSISLFWGFPLLLRRGFDYESLVMLSVANLNFSILWSCYHYGGVASPTLTWVLIIPILSLFYVGGERRLQPLLLGVTTLAFVIFFGAYWLFRPPANDVPEAAMMGLGAVSTIATLAYVATMAVYYARIFDAGVDLEIEVMRRRAIVDELRCAVALVHRAGSAKSEFLARMSHEIRTPLNAIIGYGETLLEEAEDDDKSMKDDLGRILDAAHYLVRLINMILDLAKIDAGRMTFDLHPHCLNALLEKAVAARRDLIAERGNRASVEIEAGLVAVVVDGNRFLQVLDSIVENAVMHTRGGAITLTASRMSSDDVPMLRLAIADSGEGILPEKLSSIFETFTTAQGGSCGRFGGTGLNLAVCRHLCRAMGGDIQVESERGVGATFIITLPCLAPASDRSDWIAPRLGPTPA